MKKNIEDTIEFVRKAFNGVYDKGGMPYHTHCERVWRNLITRWPNIHEDVQHAALLHDVIEDTEYTLDNLLDMGYSEETVNIVEWLSNNSSMFINMTYQQHISMLSAWGPIGAIQIKICDNQDNNRDDRLMYLDEKTQIRLKKKYNKARTVLEEGYSRRVSKDIDVVAA